jgi:hypothetical protein
MLLVPQASCIHAGAAQPDLALAQQLAQHDLQVLAVLGHLLAALGAADGVGWQEQLHRLVFLGGKGTGEPQAAAGTFVSIRCVIEDEQGGSMVDSCFEGAATAVSPAVPPPAIR